MDLFELTDTQKFAPLAERLRPSQFKDFLSPSKKLQQSVERLIKGIQLHGRMPNLILWGPPGTGKTTLANLLAQEVQGEIININAVDTGAKKLKEIGESAKLRRTHYDQHTLVFIDEIHRLNKAQQDVLLPFAEKGDFTLIGATTENPSYELNSALLSRSQVIVFERHSLENIKQVVEKTLNNSQLQVEKVLAKEAFEELIAMANGDIRQVINYCEDIIDYVLTAVNGGLESPISLPELTEILQVPLQHYDKQGDEHYNTISAFIKSIRGSDAQAGLYYLARMLRAGENPIFIARRLVILASEDVGNADPRALTIAVSGLQAVELVGMPEAGINLAQVVTYLSSSPKSNRSYLGYKKALDIVDKTKNLPIPKALKSARTKMAKDMGFGSEYLYSHDGATGWVDQEFLPDELQGEIFYEPSEHGFEKNIKKYIEWMKQK